MKISLFSLAFLFFCAGGMQAQITGRWKVDRVMVGSEVMTPVAKWFEINLEDSSGVQHSGSLLSGNGGLINTRGSWSFNAAHHELLPSNELDETDPYGPFKVKFDQGNMIWHRIEEEQEVSVSLVKVEEIPLAPWDQIVGFWKDSENHKWFIRWDRVYIRRSATDNQIVETGIWHINGHRPELMLINDQAGSPKKKWNIQFDGSDQMLWQSLDNNDTLKFHR